MYNNKMIVEIYADIVFILNFIMNSISLYLACILGGTKARYRLFLGAFISSLIYTLLLFFPRVYSFLNVFISIIFILPAVFIVFENRPFNLFRLLKQTATVFMVTFAMGGIAMAISTSFATYELITTAHFAARHFTLQNIFIAVVISFAMLKFSQKYVFKAGIARQEYCDLNIFIDGKSIKIKALIDTGNNLKDPISGSPVIIAESGIIKEILPQEMESRLRLIPFKAIGIESGILEGLKADKIEILEKNIVKNDVIIALCDFSLSKSGEYYALMNPLLL